MMVNQGLVSFTIQDREANSIKRVMSAAANPSWRAFFCCASGSLAARMLIKTILSIPRTISRKVRVTRLIQICGSINASIICFGSAFA